MNFNNFLSFIKKFLSGLKGWVWKIIPDNIKSKFGIQEVSFWGMIVSIFGVIKYWYFLIIIPSIIVLYNFIQSLKSSGILERVEKFITGILSGIVTISKMCFPLLTDLGSMISCINNVPFT